MEAPSPSPETTASPSPSKKYCTAIYGGKHQVHVIDKVDDFIWQSATATRRKKSCESRRFWRLTSPIHPMCARHVQHPHPHPHPHTLSPSAPHPHPHTPSPSHPRPHTLTLTHPRPPPLPHPPPSTLTHLEPVYTLGRSRSRPYPHPSQPHHELTSPYGYPRHKRFGCVCGWGGGEGGKG